jgi:hypothetical protein
MNLQHWTPGAPTGAAPSPDTPQAEFQLTAGFALTENFQGDQLAGTILGTVLTKNGTAAHDTTVVKTLLNPGKQHSTAFDMLLSGDSITAGALVFGDASMYVQVDGYGPLPQFGIAVILGTDDLTNGFRFRINTLGDLLVDVRIGGVVVGASLMKAIKPNAWFSAGLLISRLAGQAGVLRVATKKHQSEVAIGAGAVDSTNPLTIGNLTGSGLAWLGQTMALRIAVDPVGDVLADIQPIGALQSSAKFTTWGPVFSGVEVSDAVDVSRGAIPRTLAESTIVIGEVVEDVVIDLDDEKRATTGAIHVAQTDFTPFNLTTLGAPVVYPGYTSSSSPLNSDSLSTDNGDNWTTLRALNVAEMMVVGVFVDSVAGSRSFTLEIVARDGPGGSVIGTFAIDLEAGGSVNEILYHLLPPDIRDFGSATGINLQLELTQNTGTVSNTITPGLASAVLTLLRDRDPTQ